MNSITAPKPSIESILKSMHNEFGFFGVWYHDSSIATLKYLNSTRRIGKNCNYRFLPATFSFISWWLAFSYSTCSNTNHLLILIRNPRRVFFSILKIVFYWFKIVDEFPSQIQNFIPFGWNWNIARKISGKKTNKSIK